MRRAGNRPSAGFTLLELMLGILIIATMTAIVYGTFTNVVNTAELARGTAAELRYSQFLARNFSNNIASVYMDQTGEEPAYSFIGESADGPFGPADSLEFTTMLEMPGARALPGIIKRVRYSVVDAAEMDEGTTDDFTIDLRASEGNELMLEIYETPVVFDEEDFGFDADAMEDETIIRHVPIRSMDITYFDHESDDWVEEWDSTANNRLPWAVRIRINLARSEDDERIGFDQGVNLADDVDLDLSFSLPVAMGAVSPFLDFNHTRDAYFQHVGDRMFDRRRR